MNTKATDPNLSEKALLTTALNVFLSQGEDSVSVTKLIQLSGVSKATFYKHFANIDDVYAAILLADEQELTKILRELRLFGNVSSLLEEYLRYRIQHVERYRVMTRLERKLLKSDCNLQRFIDWQTLRRQHVAEFSDIIESKMSRSRPMDEENVRFYYGMVWALANGVAQLSELDFFHELIHDRRGFTRFLLDSVSSLGEVRS